MDQLRNISYSKILAHSYLLEKISNKTSFYSNKIAEEYFLKLVLKRYEA